MSSHIIFKEWFEGANGEKTEPVERRIHVSRKCSNCSSNGLNDPEWVADGGIEKWGVCQNGCAAAEDPDARNHWCSSHTTRSEFEAGVSRIERPVFSLVNASE